MKESIKSYIRYIDKVINSNEKGIDIKEVISEHLIKINIYQHERLIHLLVTLGFAIISILVFLLFVSSLNISLLILFICFLILLVPYIFHYYFLENNVQMLYVQYDKLKEKLK